MEEGKVHSVGITAECRRVLKNVRIQNLQVCVKAIHILGFNPPPLDLELTN